MPELPYIPPIGGELDTVSYDLLICFLEAVARVTPAFEDLSKLLPEVDPHHLPIDKISEWLVRWFPPARCSNHEVRHLIEEWAYQVLQWWLVNDAAKDAGRVDCEWWAQRMKARKCSDKQPITVRVAQWNPDREGFDQYASRMRKSFESLLQDQKRTIEKEFDRYGMRPYLKRSRGRDPIWDFEWLALSLCCQMSDGRIANKAILYPKVTRDVVKKARMTLERDLHFFPTGELRD